MAKRCIECGERISGMSFNVGVACKDGPLCSSCTTALHLDSKHFKPANIESLSLVELKGELDRRQAEVEEVADYPWTYEVGAVAKFDDENGFALLSKTYVADISPGVYTRIAYAQVLSFELLEDGGVVSSGGVKRAVAGGALFGVAGAVVGAVTAKKSGICNSLQIKIVVKDAEDPDFFISLISWEVDRSSSYYQTVSNVAQNIMSKLQLIIEGNKEGDEVESVPRQPVFDPVAEIRRYKELWDDGIITQEEFEAKKRQLLGL